ncbi:MAG: UDP-N-acetylmuramate dehydrogenase [Granulosicoccus sp.]
MIDVKQNKSLLQYNTLGFDQSAQHFVVIDDDETLLSALDYAEAQSLDVFILGGGSNLVLSKDIDAMVLHSAQPGIVYEKSESNNAVSVVVGAGIQWHSLVLDTLAQGLAGLENLSLIPGQVGAALVQNIGAYGVEIKDRIESVRALHLPTRQWRSFTAEECQFAYRDSLFKQQAGEYFITQVSFRLGSMYGPVTSYDSLSKHLERHNITAPDARQICQAVIDIRQSRLPNPKTLGNAGSFFHNPVITRQQASLLKSRYPEMTSFAVGDDRVKLSAAWMIEHLGFKGIRRGNVGVYDKQSLVLVNHSFGGKDGASLLALAKEIQSAVKECFEVRLTIEPVIL